jgi:hypothetical protein
MDDPILRNQVAISLRLEKEQRVAKIQFTNPKGFEQIESYVTQVT